LRIGWITYYFPPLGGGGIQRNFNVPEYLVRRGHKVTVYAPVPFTNLSGEFSFNGKVKRFLPLDIFHLGRGKIITAGGRRDYFSFPDNKVSSIPPLIKNIKDEDIYIISAPPFSLFLLGIYLNRKGKKWIADMRDPYTDFDLGRYIFPFSDEIALEYEHKFLVSANAIVVTTKTLKDRLLKKHKIDRIFVIPDGYEESDFQNLKVTKKDKFRISYMGTFNRAHRTDDIVEALQKICNSPLRDSFEFFHIGSATDEEKDKLKNLCFYQSPGYLKRKDAIKLLYDSDLLILTSVPSPYIIPGKTYEYLRTGIPILVISSKGELRRIIKNGIFCDNGDVDCIHKAILDAYKEKRVRKVSNFVYEYSWENIAAKYEDILWSVLS